MVHFFLVSMTSTIERFRCICKVNPHIYRFSVINNHIFGILFLGPDGTLFLGPDGVHYREVSLYL